MSEFYKLDENKRAVPCSAEEWAEQRQRMRDNSSKNVSKDFVNGIEISTIWLGIDHGGNDNRPLVFETMVFKPKSGGQECYCDRYSTWEEAQLGHQRAFQWVKEGCKESDAEND